MTRPHNKISEDFILIILTLTAWLGFLFNIYSEDFNYRCSFLFIDDLTRCDIYIYLLFEKVNQLILVSCLVLNIKRSKYFIAIIKLFICYYAKDPILYVLINNKYPNVIDVILLGIMTIFVIVRFKPNN